MRTTSVLHVRTPGGLEIHLDDAAGRVTIAGQGSTIRIDSTGITIQAAAKVDIGGVRQVKVSAGMVEVDAGMSKFSGVVQCDTLIANSVVAASYTPGAGKRAVSVAAEAPRRDRDRIGLRRRARSAGRAGAHRAERPRAGEEVQAPAARPRRRGHHAPHDRPRASASGSRSSRRRSSGTIVCHHVSVGRLPRAAFSGVTRPGAMYGSRSTSSSSKW